MSYRPVRYQGDPENLMSVVEWVQRELMAVERSYADLDMLQLVTQNVEPTKPRTGMIVLADGTNWDPGSGQGVYAYYNGAWRKLG